MKLALVDDDVDVRTAVVRLLRAMGHDVCAFASAEDFDAASVDVECAIVDVRLPVVSGVDLSERLRRRTPPLPVILITGDGDWATRVSSTPVVTKPFDEMALSSAIALATSSRMLP